jgi:hypothetical protein
MTDHSHDNVKAYGGVAVIASFPTRPARAADTTVNVGVFVFAPQQQAVTAVATISWNNESKVPGTDDTCSFTFTIAGVYEGDGSLYLHMVGTIVVEAAAGSDFPR